MKLLKLKTENFRLFEDDFSLEFPNSNTIVLIGNNGSGKSALLDGIALTLAHLISVLSSSSEPYYIDCDLKSDDITVGKQKSNVGLEFDGLGHRLEVTISIDKGNRALKFDYDELLVQQIKNDIVEKKVKQLPIIVYYRTNRTKQTTVKNEKVKNFYDKKLHAYEYALSERYFDFNDFERWFINEENIENQEKIKRKDFDFENKPLQNVRRAITRFLNGFKGSMFHNLRVERRSNNLNVPFDTKTTKADLVISKLNTDLKLSQLSSGEKMLIYLVCDITRRLTIANDEEDFDVLNGKGIVLIDELELHLHPSWQRVIIDSLKNTFPNIQFLCTTHSPQILSEVSEKEIIFLENGHLFGLSSDPRGRDTNGILEEVMGSSKRPLVVEELIQQIFKTITIGKNGDTVATIKEDLNRLQGLVSKDDPVLLRINALLNRKKIIL